MTSVLKTIEKAATANVTADKANAARQHNNSVVSLAREGATLYASGGAARERGLSLTTGALAIAYQSDDYMRRKVDAYLASKNRDTSKVVREDAQAWLADIFDVHKPASGARPLSKYTYANRVAALTNAMQRVVDCHKLGLVFRQDMKDSRKFYVTLDSYRKVTGDMEAKDDVLVSDKAHANSEATTWAALTRKPKGEKVIAKKDAPTVTAGNVRTICAGIVNGLEAEGGIDVEKLSGADRLSMLQAFFALGAALGSNVHKTDKTLLTEYDNLVKAQAA